MILGKIDRKIRQAFSDAAIQYDVLTSMHKEIGRELAQKVIKMDDCASILDVGMGTGKLAKRLTFYFPDALVVGLDYAAGMVDFVRKQNEPLKLIQADGARLPFKQESFDVVISNLAYQWINPLPAAFEDAYRALKKDGLFLFTMFGEDTLNELLQSVEAALKQHNRNGRKLKRLPKKEDVEQAMHRAGFNDISLDYERIKVHFPDMMDLLRWVKSIGANVHDQYIFLGKQILRSAQEHYVKNYKDRFGITATFEVIWAEGVNKKLKVESRK